MQKLASTARRLLSSQRAPSSRGRWALALAPLCAAVLVLGGCQPKIGDSCSVASDCSQTGERICDNTQPGGYCTIFGCDPKSCPSDESICVAFGAERSVAGDCADPGRASPYERNFCMARCSKDEDCRGGYVCVDMAEDNPWGANVVTRNPPTTKVCVLPFSGAELPDERAADYCLGSTSDFDFGAGGAGEPPSAAAGASATP